MSAPLLARAHWADVLSGRAPLVGSRLDATARRGFVSPVEARCHLGLLYDDDLMQVERETLDAEPRSLARQVSTAIKGLTTSLLAAEASEVPRPRVLSSCVDNISIEDAVDHMVRHPGPRTKMVHFVHPHALNLAARDSVLREALARADLVLPDGVGLRIAAKILGHPLRHNVNGTDLLPWLCRRLAREGVALCLVGAEAGVARLCAARLREQHPGLATPLVHHGFLDDATSAAVVARLRRVGRCVVLVGMGSPRQERWAWQHLRDLRGATVVTVGGLFDFYSERIPRAPIAWRDLGLEWLWRLRQEPSRLAHRYLMGNPAFMARVVRQRLSG